MFIVGNHFTLHVPNFLFLPTNIFQVVIVGNGAVGKSSMIQRYCRGVFTKAYKKTIGVDFLEKRMRSVALEV